MMSNGDVIQASKTTAIDDSTAVQIIFLPEVDKDGRSSAWLHVT